MFGFKKGKKNNKTNSYDSNTNPTNIIHETKTIIKPTIPIHNKQNIISCVDDEVSL